MAIIFWGVMIVLGCFALLRIMAESVGEHPPEGCIDNLFALIAIGGIGVFMLIILLMVLLEAT